MITAEELRKIYTGGDLSDSFSRIATDRMNNGFDFCLVSKHNDDLYEDWKKFVEELKQNGYSVKERVVGGVDSVIVEW